MMSLCLDLRQIIFKYLNFNTKHRFRMIDKQNQKLQIIDMCYIPSKYIRNINDRILKKYKYITMLYQYQKYDITNMTNLRVLCCEYNHIAQTDVNNLKKLEILGIRNNYQIMDVNCLTNLRIFYANYFVNGVSKCVKLEALNLSQNK